MAHTWEEFGEAFEGTIREYMPDWGEGESMASQSCTAVNKLIYKWFNDGDVFDNTYALTGWMNDISSQANWLRRYRPETKDILDGIADCFGEDDYTELLWNLAKAALDREAIEGLAGCEKMDSIYDCEGPFQFVEEDEEDEEW